MTINIQKCSNVNVIGHHNHKNCKPVYCIDTGEIYASAIDAANANGVTKPPMSAVLTGKTKTCNGKRFCYVSKMMEHLDEINEANRIRAEKIAAYDAMMAKQSKAVELKDSIEKRNARINKLKEQLEKESYLLADEADELRELEEA